MMISKKICHRELRSDLYIDKEMTLFNCTTFINAIVIKYAKNLIINRMI